MTRTHLNKLGRDLILDILNRTNASDITFAEVDFSTPEVVAGAGMNRNTTVLVTALPNGRYKGERRVYYWRLPIQQVISEEYRRFPMLGMPTNTLMIAQEINTRYNLRLTAEDIHVDPISVLEKPFNVTIRTKPGSYAFLGEVTMQIVEPAIDLSDVITVNLLDGLYYPEDVVYTLGGLNFVQPGNGLLHVGAVNDTGVWVGNNAELEIGTGFRLNGVTDSLAPAAGNNYTHVIGADWSIIASLELLDDARGDNLISLYDVTLQVIHENGGDVEMFLRRDEVTNTLYFETNHGPATRLPMLSAPGDWGLIKLQTLVPIGQIRNGFINLDYTDGVAAGRFTVIMEAKAKGTVLSPAIRIENTILVDREAAAIPDMPLTINVAYSEANNDFPLILSLFDPNDNDNVVSGQNVTWLVTNSAGRTATFSGLSQYSEFYGNGIEYTTWYDESSQITVTATIGSNSYTTTYELNPPSGGEIPNKIHFVSVNGGNRLAAYNPVAKELIPVSLSLPPDSNTETAPIQLAYNPNNDTLAVSRSTWESSNNHKVEIYDATTWDLLDTIVLPGRVHCVKYNKQFDRLVFGHAEAPFYRVYEVTSSSTYDSATLTLMTGLPTLTNVMSWHGVLDCAFDSYHEYDLALIAPSFVDQDLVLIRTIPAVGGSPALGASIRWTRSSSVVDGNLKSVLFLEGTSPKLIAVGSGNAVGKPLTVLNANDFTVAAGFALSPLLASTAVGFRQAVDKIALSTDWSEMYIQSNHSSNSFLSRYNLQTQTWATEINLSTVWSGGISRNFAVDPDGQYLAWGTNLMLDTSDWSVIAHPTMRSLYGLPSLQSVYIEIGMPGSGYIPS